MLADLSLTIRSFLSLDQLLCAPRQRRVPWAEQRLFIGDTLSEFTSLFEDFNGFLSTRAPCVVHLSYMCIFKLIDAKLRKYWFHGVLLLFVLITYE